MSNNIQQKIADVSGYLDPVFDKTQRWIWTGDTYKPGNTTGAWVPYFVDEIEIGASSATTTASAWHVEDNPLILRCRPRQPETA